MLHAGLDINARSWQVNSVLGQLNASWSYLTRQVKNKRDVLRFADILDKDCNNMIIITA